MIKYYRIGCTDIKLDTDTPFYDGKETMPFLTNKKEDCAVCVYRGRDGIIPPQGKRVFSSDILNVYKTDEGFERVYALPMMKEKAAVVKKVNGNIFCEYNRLYSIFFSHPVNLMNAVGLESVFADRNAFILHCSFIEHGGKAVLFSGSSGSGKSTRAEMWVKNAGARLINGDKALIYEKDGRFFASGLPVAGSSGIFINETLEISAVVFLGKGAFTRTERISGVKAFSHVYRNMIINSWDADFALRASEFEGKLCEAVPVYYSQCSLDSDSVQKQRDIMKI